MDTELLNVDLLLYLATDRLKHSDEEEPTLNIFVESPSLLPMIPLPLRYVGKATHRDGWIYQAKAADVVKAMNRIKLER